MISWVLRFILFMVVIRLIWRFLSGIIDGLSPEPARSKRGAKAASVPLVRDPVCGTYVPRASAKVIGTGDDTLYFCSDKCRDEYGKGRAASR